MRILHGFKRKLQKSELVVRGYRSFRILLTNISPTLNVKVTYLLAKGRRINLKAPSTLEEKILWLKLNTYRENELVTICCDKFEVRNYVKENGWENILIDLIGVYKSEEDIDWSKLPEKFVLKCNHGSGFNIICKDKNKLDIEKAKSQLNSWMKEEQWKSYAEMNYKNMEKRITCEKYIETKNGHLPTDYKIYCFNGVPKAVLVIADRDGETKGSFMSTDWELLSYTEKYKANDIPEKPLSLETMLNAAASLSKPFPFVRVDFYQGNDRAIFGEMTFTPAGGLYTSQTDIEGVTMGELLEI